MFLYLPQVGEEGNLHSFYSNYTCCLMSLISLLMCQQLTKSDYSCEKLVKLKYRVKIMGHCVERKDATASEVPTLMNCSYGANFQLIVIKHAEETTSGTLAQKFHVAVLNV
jgi:hypothetical protein